MGKPGTADAWDDDWVNQADRTQRVAEPEPATVVPMTKAQRLAQHAETNRRLWQSADTVETNHFVEATTNVPLTSGFKPQVKVLSRKPPPVRKIARRDPITGELSPLSLGGHGDDDDDDDDAETTQPVRLSPEEIRAKQQRDREEKQRRYDEARAKIFGESNPSSGASSPGTVTPPRSDSRGGHHNSRGRGRNRGRGNFAGNRQQQQQQQQQPNQQQYTQQIPQQQLRTEEVNSRPTSRSEARELYDPNFSPKPGFTMQKRFGDNPQHPGRFSPKQDDIKQAIRAPRGPDGSGRGGFGFAQRGNREG